jgi:hypothetical protein
MTAPPSEGLVPMTVKKYLILVLDALPSPIRHAPDQLSEATGSLTARTVICNEVRLLACVALLCGVTACGSQPGRTTATSADAALGQAMELENVPKSWYDSLHFIMFKESGGRIGIKNPDDSCRGLFQLSKENYDLNPHGIASFGNGVEEAQGGIRYIKKRYRTADDAMEYWKQHRWY